jgi:phosphatidylinositol alpha-1,6-mannosyltransferase
VRILALVSDGLGAHGGIAAYNRHLFAALSQCSAVSSVKILPRHGDAMAHVPPRCTQDPPIDDRMRWVASASAQAVCKSFDVIFCGHLFAAPLAAALANRRKLWIQAHGIEAWPEPRSPMRYAVERADLVTAVSRYTRARLLRWIDIDPIRVRVLSNMFSPGFAARPRRIDLVARYGLQGRKVILTVGRLAAGERYKGHDRIILALPETLKQCPDACYLIVGGGEDEARLRRLAQSKNVAGRVIFAGDVSDEDLPDYFALADGFVMPSTGEGFGIAFLEAAATGLPVIGGNRDGSIDALADGAIGRLIDPLSQEEIAAALIDALNGRIASAAEAAQRFSFPNFAAHVDALVRNLAH